MTALARRLTVFFALLGLGATAASTYVHYQLLRDPAYTSFCDVSSTLSCSQVYLSRFGSIAGVPVALLGGVWFGFVLVLTLGARLGSSESQENVPGYLFAFSTLALAVSLYLGYVSLFVLKAVCVLCMTTYAAVIGLFLISGSATAFPMTTLPRRALRDFRALFTSPAALAVSILFLVGAGLAVAFFPREAATTAAASQLAPINDDTRSEFERWYESQPRVEVPVPKEEAAVVIVKFNDYQCPPCRQTYLEYQPILEKYRSRYLGLVRFVIKDYPLDPECNANTPNGSHLAACEAAVAVRLAGRRREGERLENQLFTNQQLLSPAWVRQTAREFGINDFEAEYARTLEQVKADIALGGLLGVQATPTFFINGVKVQGGLQPQFFDAAIAYELKKAGK